MPAPTTSDELLAIIRKSEVVDLDRFNAYIEALDQAAMLPDSPKALAALLIRDAILTNFQAEQFLLGHYRGLTVAKYRLLERIGSGGMGQVFLAEHIHLRRRVAVKILPPARAKDPATLGRFYREARAAALIDHPNIARTHDIGQEGALHYIIMEYVDGASLLEIVRKFGPLSVDRAAHYIYQAALGLDHAHNSGIIHRDVKPGNIMVDRQGVVKILDMGLARIYFDETDLLTLQFDDQGVLGTADYVAPEQTVDSHTVDTRADIYGLGCTFYFLLAGHPPFPQGTVAQKVMWHQTQPPRSITEICPNLPQDIASLIHCMLAKHPDNRPQTPAQVAAELEAFVRSQPIDPPSSDEMPKLSPAASGVGGVPSDPTRPRSDKAIRSPGSSVSLSVSELQVSKPPSSHPRIVPPPSTQPAASVQKQTQSQGHAHAQAVAKTNGSASKPQATIDTRRLLSSSDKTPASSQDRPAAVPAMFLQPFQVPKRKAGVATIILLLFVAMLVGAVVGYFVWRRIG